MPSVPWPTCLTLFAGGVGSPPSPTTPRGCLGFACTPPDALPPPLVPYERQNVT